MSIELLVHERDIEQVLLRYCRSIDRLDWDLLRTCYHPGAVDEHGRYNGEIDGFIEWLDVEMQAYESTLHVMGNRLIGCEGDQAHVESYAVAYHRLASDDDTIRDRVVWVRYLDRFRRIDERWAIEHRRCIFEFARIDDVSPVSRLPIEYQRGRRDRDDPSYDLYMLR